MAKSIRSKRMKRLRTIKRNTVVKVRQQAQAARSTKMLADEVAARQQKPMLRNLRAALQGAATRNRAARAAARQGSVDEDADMADAPTSAGAAALAAFDAGDAVGAGGGAGAGAGAGAAVVGKPQRLSREIQKQPASTIVISSSRTGKRRTQLARTRKKTKGSGRQLPRNSVKTLKKN